MALLKDCKIQIKAGPDDGLAEGEFTAYASVFGNKDSYGDIVMPGAFEETLAEWKDSGNVIPLLFGHNMQDPDYNIGEVLEAKEDDHGLLTRNLLDLENPKAAQTYRLLKGRRLSQMSFAYDVLEGGEAERERADGSKEFIYELRKLKLYEVSTVPIGANQETEILAVKAAQSALRLDAGNLTEATRSELSKAIKALGDLLNGGQDNATSHTGPSKPGGSGDTVTGSKASPAARLKLLAAMQTQLELEGAMS
jgi:HK97 family phage prohead protease